MIKIFIIGSGGFCGAVLRYLVINAVTSFAIRISGNSSFPFGTLVVNVVGCFIIGLLGGLLEYRQLFSHEARLFVFIGLLGGFTTFSTFGYDALNLAREGETLSMVNYIVSHLAFGLLAVWTGHLLSKFLWG